MNLSHMKACVRGCRNVMETAKSNFQEDDVDKLSGYTYDWQIRLYRFLLLIDIPGQFKVVLLIDGTPWCIHTSTTCKK